MDSQKFNLPGLWKQFVFRLLAMMVDTRLTSQIRRKKNIRDLRTRLKKKLQINNCGKHNWTYCISSFPEWINPWKRGLVWRLVLLQSLFLISPLFLNISYSPSAILDYDWHFSYVAYIREKPKQEPAGRRKGKYFSKFFIKKVSSVKSTSGFCCWDSSLSYLFQSLLLFLHIYCWVFLMHIPLCILRFPDNLAANKTLLHLKPSNWPPATSSPTLGIMLTQSPSHQLSWILHYTPLWFSKLSNAFLHAIGWIICFLENVSFY